MAYCNAKKEKNGAVRIFTSIIIKCFIVFLHFKSPWNAKPTVRARNFKEREYGKHAITAVAFRGRQNFEMRQKLPGARLNSKSKVQFSQWKVLY